MALRIGEGVDEQDRSTGRSSRTGTVEEVTLGDRQRRLRWEQDEVEAAAREAAAIGGRAGDEQLDPAQRPLVEAGEGVAEGFELAEEDLIEAAEYRARASDPFNGALPADRDRGRLVGVFAEADHESSSEVVDSDR